MRRGMRLRRPGASVGGAAAMAGWCVQVQGHLAGGAAHPLCDAAGHPALLLLTLRCLWPPCVASGHPALLLVALCCCWLPYVAGHLQRCAAVVLAGAWAVQLLLAALLQPQAWDFTWPLTASSSGDTHTAKRHASDAGCRGKSL